MQRKITDVFSDLLGLPRRRAAANERAEQARLGNSVAAQQHMLDDYKNLYWTRVISMEGFRDGEQERHELGPDVAAEMEEMHLLDGDELPEWTPLFDPQRFQQEHPQLLLQDWQLSQDEFLQMAIQVSQIRKTID